MHEFAQNVMRPAAADWDEREETPWPILEEASKIGLYSLDFFAGQWFERAEPGSERPPRRPATLQPATLPPGHLAARPPGG